MTPELPPIFGAIAKHSTYKGVKSTKNGERHLFELQVNDTFWNVYRNNKEDLLACGLGLRKDDFGTWKAAVWLPVSVAEAKVRNATTELSSAVHSDLFVKMGGGVVLRPYQAAAVEFITSRKGTLLVDPPGAGKTLTIVGVCNHLEVKNALIIVPASVKIQFYESLKKAIAYDVEITMIKNGKSALPAAGIIVVNYELVNKIPGLRTRVYDLMACDEAHNLKNRKAGRTMHVLGGVVRDKEKRIKASFEAIPANVKVFATGTPAVNRPVELWNLLQACDKQRWSNFLSFGTRYCAGHKNGFGWDFTGSSNIDELHSILRSTIMIRREKKDIQPFQPKKQRQLVKLENTLDKATIEKDRAMQAQMAGFHDLVGALSDETKVKFDEVAALRHKLALEKVPAAADFIAQFEEPVVVMGHHKDALKLVGDKLVKEGKRVLYYTGDMNLQQRDDAKKAFMAGEADIIMGTIGAMGTGVDGLQRASNIMVFIESSYVPGHIEQAEDRLARDGQENVVLIYHLVIDGTYEVKVLQTAIDKEQVLAPLIQGRTNVEAAKAEERGEPAPAVRAIPVFKGDPDLVKIYDRPVALPVDYVAPLAVTEKAEALRQHPGAVGTAIRHVDSFLRNPTPLMEVIVNAAHARCVADHAKLTRPIPDAVDKELLQACVDYLTGLDSDRATHKNHSGWNAADTRYGHLMSMLGVTGDAIPMLRKYEGQLATFVENWKCKR